MIELEDQYRFTVTAITIYPGSADLSLRCTRCGRWTAHIDSPLVLADLNQRAAEHVEVCP